MKQWDFLVKKFESGSLAHAYVFSGQPMEALKAVAKELAALTNQNIPNAHMLIEKHAFPDLLVVHSAQSESSIKNEKDMMEIDVDQIRTVQQFLSYKPYYAGYKCVIIENAERMNTEAQNCFLKSLEEPKGNTLIILLAEKPELLLPTIFSRCQVINFLEKGSGQPAEPLSKELAGVITADLAEKFKYAKAVNLEGGNFERIIGALQQHFRKDIITYKHVLTKLLEVERQVQTTNLNKKLALEIVLMEL